MRKVPSISGYDLYQNPGLCVSVYKEVSSYPCTDVMRRLFENKDTCNDNCVHRSTDKNNGDHSKKKK